MKNVEEIAWDSTEGNELINTTGHGTPADMFVKLKDGRILGISLKKDGHIRIHNGGYIEVTKEIAKGMRIVKRTMLPKPFNIVSTLNMMD